MKNLSVYSVNQKNLIASDVPWLFALKVHVIDPTTKTVVDYLRIVRNTESVTINGEAYQPLIFDIKSDTKIGELPSLTVEIQDQHGTIAKHIQEYKGGVGSKVELMVFAIDDVSKNIVPEAELTEYFEILTASVKSYVASWNLGTENPLRVKFPRRKQFKDQCPWRYKSDDCGYVGTKPSCDLTYKGSNGCIEHENGGNFGGFPGLQSR